MWKCKQCGKKYESRHDAWMCCASVETRYKCTLCGESYWTKESAYKCTCNEPIQYDPNAHAPGQRFLFDKMKGGKLKTGK